MESVPIEGDRFLNGVSWSGEHLPSAWHDGLKKMWQRHIQKWGKDTYLIVAKTHSIVAKTYLIMSKTHLIVAKTHI